MQWTNLCTIELDENLHEVVRPVRGLDDFIVTVQRRGAQLIGLVLVGADRVDLKIATRNPERVHLAITPMTETVKLVESRRICATINRDSLWEVRLPIVAPARILLTILREIDAAADLLPALSAGRWPISALWPDPA